LHDAVVCNAGLQIPGANNGAGKKLLAKHHPLKTKLTMTQARKTVTGKTITPKPKPKPKPKKKKKD
jgi:hypothetical protein